MLSVVMMKLLSSGFVGVQNTGDHHILLRRLPTLAELKEEDLHKSDQEIKKEVNQKERRASMMVLAGFTAYPRLIMGAMMMNVAAAQPDGEKMKEDQWSLGDFYMLMLIFFSYLTLRFLEWLATCALSPPRKKKKKDYVDSDSQEGEVDCRETTPVSEARSKVRPSISPDLRTVTRRLNLEPEQSMYEDQLWFTPSGECFHRRSDSSGLKNSRSKMVKRRCMNCMPTTKAQSSSGV